MFKFSNISLLLRLYIVAMISFNLSSNALRTAQINRTERSGDPAALNALVVLPDLAIALA
jgi:hypothetical protein